MALSPPVWVVVGLLHCRDEVDVFHSPQPTGLCKFV